MLRIPAIVILCLSRSSSWDNISPFHPSHWPHSPRAPFTLAGAPPDHFLHLREKSESLACSGLRQRFSGGSLMRQFSGPTKMAYRLKLFTMSVGALKCCPSPHTISLHQSHGSAKHSSVLHSVGPGRPEG